MTSRSYSSDVRTAAAAEKRERVIQTAAELLRQPGNAANLSLDAVAKAAGVTRLTLYNQFGSRRGLLEAVFDDIAIRGRLGRISQVAALPDPRQGLERMLEICCDFWGSDPALPQIYDAMAFDQELEQSLNERNERRRQLIQSLLQRIATRPLKRELLRDSVDMIFALSSLAMFRLLAPGRSPADVQALLKTSVDAVLARFDH